MSGKTEYTIAFVGNPNSGKSTLFNALTGARQQIGNWPGVTVERVEGSYLFNDIKYSLIDLPGIYSLTPNTEDERVSRDYILENDADLVVNVVDSSNLARNLYLTAQLIEMKVPVIVVLNMMDLARANGYSIDIEHLSAHLKCPVFAMSAVEQADVRKLRENLLFYIENKTVSDAVIKYPNEIEDQIKNWSEKIENSGVKFRLDLRWMLLRVIEEDHWITEKITRTSILEKEEIVAGIEKIKTILNEAPDMVIADYVYGAVNGVCREVLQKVKTAKPVSDRIDSVVMHPFLGVPVFLLVMLLVFFVTIEIGNIFVDWFDQLAGIVFVDGFGSLISMTGAPGWVRYLLADGVGSGIQTVISFIPFVFFMFLMLSLLEDSGYMARAAFVMDKFMGKLGLPGKAFVPMIVGFGCTVPAILATRTLDNKRDRMITVFMVPMMSCGAKLPVYALFAAAFFPHSTGFIVFSLYLAGILVAILSGLLIKFTLFSGEPSHLIMELPRYHVPRARHILLHTWTRVKDFIKRAGKVIIVAVFLLSVLSSITINGKFEPHNTGDSVLSSVGKVLTPVFTPMGVSEDNWPATVGLFTGILAKESIVGTLSALYSQTESTEAHESGFAVLRSRFSSAAAYAYLLFVLLYMPCIAAVSAAMKEISVKFGLLQAFYLTIVAWIFSTLFFQIAEGHNPVLIIIPLLIVILITAAFKTAGNYFRRQDRLYKDPVDG